MSIYRCARRRRSGGPGEGCAGMPVGTYLYLHAVGASNHVAMLGLARWGARRYTGTCHPWDQQLSGSLVRRVWKIKQASQRTPLRA
jgi:hypothetical protein